MYEWEGFSKAKQAALDASRKEHNTPIYVNWIEDNFYTISYEPELKDEAYALNGEWVYPQD